MCGSTHEEAILELNKPTEVADFHVQYNPPGKCDNVMFLGEMCNNKNV